MSDARRRAMLDAEYSWEERGVYAIKMTDGSRWGEPAWCDDVYDLSDLYEDAHADATETRLPVAERIASECWSSHENAAEAIKDALGEYADEYDINDIIHYLCIFTGSFWYLKDEENFYEDVEEYLK